MTKNAPPDLAKVADFVRGITPHGSRVDPWLKRVGAVSPHVVFPEGGKVGESPYICYRDPAAPDRWVTSRPGKAIRRVLTLLHKHGVLKYDLLAGFNDKDVAAYCDDVAGIVLYENTLAPLHIASDVKGIKWVYDNGPSSCMAKMGWACGQIYGGAPDLGVAYVTSDGSPNGSVTARAVVHLKDGVYLTMYGDTRRLQSALEAEGYSKRTEYWYGVKLPRIRDCDDDEAFVMPYLDIALAVQQLDRDWWVTAKSGYDCGSTEALLFESERRCETCDACGEASDNIINYDEWDERLCPGCAPQSWRGGSLDPEDVHSHEELIDGLWYPRDGIILCPFTSRQIHPALPDAEYAVIPDGDSITVDLVFRQDIPGWQGLSQAPVTRVSGSTGIHGSEDCPCYVHDSLLNPEHPRFEEAVKLAGGDPDDYRKDSDDDD